MAGKIIQASAVGAHSTALVAADDSVWVSLSPRWWDLASWLWWWLCPSDRRAWVILTNGQGVRIRTRAIRVARRYVRIRAMPAQWSEDDE